LKQFRFGQPVARHRRQADCERRVCEVFPLGKPGNAVHDDRPLRLVNRQFVIGVELIDGSFDVGGEWWVNLHSRGRALLMLFLFTDVGLDDAPTRILVGSHRDVPPILEPMGDAGTHFDRVLPMIPHVHKRETALATGEAGDVYLCHPFLVPRGRIGVPARASWRSRSFHPSHR
jgi:hypothetical protein